MECILFCSCWKRPPTGRDWVAEIIMKQSEEESAVSAYCRIQASRNLTPSLQGDTSEVITEANQGRKLKICSLFLLAMVVSPDSLK